MNIRDHIRALNTERLKIHNEINRQLDNAPGGRMTPELRASVDELNGKLTEVEGEIRRHVDQEEREQESAAVRNQFAGAFSAAGGSSSNASRRRSPRTSRRRCSARPTTKRR